MVFLARAYINHPRGVRIDKNRLYASNIFNWYKADFGGSDSNLIQHFLRYADAGLASELKSFKGSIRYSYDWRLNEE